MIREKLKRLFSNAECSPFEREVRRRLTWRVILLAISPLPLLLLLIHFLYLRVMFNSESIIDLHDRNVNAATRIKCLEEKMQQIQEKLNHDNTK
jgi:hypothetical protein